MQPTSSHHFHALGKLLITGEYVVLEGAIALALPTRLGQSLSVRPTHKKGCHWISKNADNEIWFEVFFGTDAATIHCNDEQVPIAEKLLAMLRTAQELNPSFTPFNQSIEVETNLEFPRDWGLGTSSTLLYNISQWAQVDAVKLLQKSFGGSGYDVAVAKHAHAILYRLDKKKPKVKTVTLDWDFKDQLYFVHLNVKQDSKEGIALYKKASKDTDAPIGRITELTLQIVKCSRLDRCIELFEEHEEILSLHLGIETVKNRLFPDFNGFVKSLGAWGGDFVLAGGIEDAQNYFRDKGYETVIPFSEMILSDTLQ